MFWNDSCKNLTQYLCKGFPNHKPHKKNSFRCLHPNIKFDYYSSNKNYNPYLVFNEIDIDDNTDKKIKLENKLIGKEITRYSKELNKCPNNSTNKKCFEKHCKFIDKIDEKVNNLDGFMRSQRIQILPDIRQKKILYQWFYGCVCVYNRLVSHFTQIYTKYERIVQEMDIGDRKKVIQLAKNLKNNTEFPINFEKLRELKIGDFCKDYYLVPYCIIADIIKEFVSNIKSNITNMLKHNMTSFQFKHRKIKRMQHSITIESHYTTERGFYPSILGAIYINASNFEWKDIKHDYKLIYEKFTGKYYIHVPRIVFPKKPIKKRKPIAVMDPGERKFQTLYGLDHIIKIGENIRVPIEKRLRKIDDLKKKIDTPGTKKYNKKLRKMTRVNKWKYKRAIARHHQKLDHLQQELHHKTAIFLCENYDRIIVTDFSSKKVGNKKGKLNKMSKRVLGKVSHYRFRQCLQNKCQEYGCQYYEFSEAYTSKTCCVCGNIKDDLGSNEVYKCKKCGNTIDRDVNAAICILLKNHELVLTFD